MSETNEETNPVERIVMWEDGCKPREAGWYGTHYSWDVLEGSFCYSNYFDGNDWKENLPIFQIAGPFDAEDLADKWCEANDVSW